MQPRRSRCVVVPNINIDMACICPVSCRAPVTPLHALTPRPPPVYPYLFQHCQHKLPIRSILSFFTYSPTPSPGALSRDTMAANVDDETRKNRITSHMNRDHTREMSNYLRHYNSLSKRQAANPSMRDVSFDAMHIRAGGFNHAVPFVPPLRSWDEIRPRLVEMDAAARKDLGVSDITVTTYVAPRPGHWVILLAVAFYFASAASLPWIVPGSTAWTLLDRGFPGGAPLFRWLVKVLLVPVLGIHVVECYFLDRLRLSRHGVEPFTGTWLLWQASCFLEGIMCWRRFDELVAEKQKQKDAKKH